MYKEIEEQEIKRWSVVINTNSTCWMRTHAHMDKSRMICKWEVRESYRSLFDLLHEIGHIETNRSSMLRCEQESEATRWAVNRLKELGFPIKQRILKLYKEYINMTYERGVRRGMQKRVKSKLYL